MSTDPFTSFCVDVVNVLTKEEVFGYSRLSSGNLGKVGITWRLGRVLTVLHFVFLTPSSRQNSFYKDPGPTGALKKTCS